MSALPEYVRLGETILWRARPTLRSMASRAIATLVAVLFFGSILFNAMGGGAALAAPFVLTALLLLYLAVMLVQGLRLKRTEYVLTDHGVYTRTGLIGQSVAQTTFDKITDIALKQDVLGRLLGYATLQVNTAGSNLAALEMSGLPDALNTKQRIEAAREKAVAARMPGAPTPAAAAGVRRFVLAADVLEVRCPNTRLLFKRPRSQAGRRVPCPHCRRAHVAKEA